MSDKFDFEKACELEPGVLAVSSRHRKAFAAPSDTVAAKLTPAQAEAIAQSAISLIDNLKVAGIASQPFTIGNVTFNLSESGADNFLSIRTSAIKTAA